MMTTKTRQVRAELFHADGRTDRHDELLVAFRNFAKAPKIIRIMRHFCVSVRAYVIYTLSRLGASSGSSRKGMHPHTRVTGYTE